MKGITKVFPGVVANDNVSFAVERSSIHALVGENGAGKTTLMRVLYGMYKPDAGEIFLDGRQVNISSPHDSIELGIGMVHQEFQLVPSLTVAENIVLGYEPHKGIWLDKQTMQAQVSEISERFGLHVDPDMPIREIPVGVQQRVEILKLLYRQAELLILDEPTAVLTPQEVEGFFQVLKRLCSQGHTIILITHKLKEVMSICNYATVLRRGVNVGTVEVAMSCEAEIASLMVGREVEHKYQKDEISSPVPKLVCEDVSALDNRRLPALRSISFTVNAGEILGIAGVEGNGQSELVEVLAGQRQAEGKITLVKPEWR
jgi:simple sugar transport system ATP-binding protein